MMSRKVQIAVIVALSLIVVGMYVVLGGLFLARRNSQDTRRSYITYPDPGVQRISAHQAYAQAQALAQNWQADAQLVGTRASFRQETPGAVGGGQTWSFQFFSPSTSQLYLLPVQGEQPQAESVAVRPVHAEMTFVEVTQWQVDSEDALLLFLSHGGEDFLRQHPEAVINLQLVPPKKEGGLIWLASGVAQAGREVFFVQIDAQTGSIVPQESS
ncbi:MAG: hypothetical protein SVX38_12470 [Chloroflexota bacterium]|nr:hypothetical protein [Chloroflexota bacterium]